MMDEHDDGRAAGKYDETEEPQNPPDSVLRPEVRNAAWWLYVAPLILICAAIAVALMYWTGRNTRPVEEAGMLDGTSGIQALPEGRSGERAIESTTDELRYRGAGSESSPGSLSSLMEGQRVRLEGLPVVRVSADGTFVLEYGGQEITVVAKREDVRGIRDGMRVDVTGFVVQDAQHGRRIRATRILTR